MYNTQFCDYLFVPTSSHSLPLIGTYALIKNKQFNSFLNLKFMADLWLLLINELIKSLTLDQYFLNYLLLKLCKASLDNQKSFYPEGTTLLTNRHI